MIYASERRREKDKEWCVRDRDSEESTDLLNSFSKWIKELITSESSLKKNEIIHFQVSSLIQLSSVLTLSMKYVLFRLVPE